MARKGKAKVLTKEEFNKVDAICLYNKHPKRNRAIFYLSVEHGMRACEIRDLKVGDLFDAHGNLKETISLTKTKRNEARENYINNKKVINVLLDHLNELKSYLNEKKIPFSQNTPLFISQKEGKFFSNGIVIILAKLYRKAGIEGAKSHSGRRTFITEKINQGYDPKSISKIVGHKNVSQTWAYYEVSPERLKKISEKSVF